MRLLMVSHAVGDIAMNKAATQGRVPPHNKEAELQVLGAVFLDNRALSFVRPILEPEHFYVDAHRIVFDAMCDIADKKQPVDAVTVGTKLQEDDNLKRIGGSAFIAALTDGIVTTVNADTHAKMIRALFARREMIRTAMEIAAQGYNSSEGTKRYLSSSAERIAQVSQKLSISKGPQRLDDDLKTIHRDLEKGEEPKGVIQTGIPAIDALTGGLFPEPIVVAGRPAMGKSTFVENIAINVALAGKKVLFIKLEDRRIQTARRLLARFADINAKALRMNQIKPDQWPKLTKAVAHLACKRPLWVEDTPGLNLADIRQIVFAHNLTYGIDLLIVDHIGDVAEKRQKSESETDRIGRIASELRNLGNELEVPNILVHQLNRDLERRPDKRPILADLKQAGKVEEVARVVFFPFRPGAYEQNGDERRDMHLLIAKATNGRIGMIPLWCNLSRMYIRGWDETTDGPLPEYQLGKSASQEPKNQHTSSWRAKYDY